MKHGHDPREVREYPMRDLELLLTLEQTPPELAALIGDN